MSEKVGKFMDIKSGIKHGLESVRYGKYLHATSPDLVDLLVQRDR